MTSNEHISKNDFLPLFEPEDRGKAEVLFKRILSEEVSVVDIPSDSLFQEGKNASRYLVGLNKQLEAKGILDVPFDVDRIVSVADRYPQYFDKGEITKAVNSLDIENVYTAVSNNVPVISESPIIQELFMLMPTGQGEHTHMSDSTLHALSGIKTDALEAYILASSVEQKDGIDSPSYQRANSRMMMQVMKFSETARIYTEAEEENALPKARGQVGVALGRTIESEIDHALEVFEAEVKPLKESNDVDVNKVDALPSPPDIESFVTNSQRAI